MSRVEASSGARYSAHKEGARKFEPIAPVGTNYKPVGAPDIAALRKGGTSAANPSMSAAATRSVPLAPARAAGFGQPVPVVFNKASAPDDAWGAPTVTKAPPLPSGTRPSVVTSTKPVPTVS